MPEADMDSDSDSEEDIECTGMLLPPLIKQLRGILDEYPDNGQIIKELIQNAEDAEATEMKLMYDGRQINQNPERKNIFRKFFKAPALCAYNDARFTEADWDGIRMLYSSIKEEDALKVGRFGLGFKSVFHLTDNLCIISGDRILFLDPHQKDTGRVCQTVKLKKLDRCKRLNVADLLTALDGLFGISENILNTGHYNGTLFWFPLRKNKSELSETLYTESKVANLYHSFQNEASISLLYLKSLERIELHAKYCSDSSQIPSLSPLFAVKICGTGGIDVRQNKSSFARSIKDLKGKLPEDSLNCSLRITVNTSYYRRQKPPEVKSREWLVVNYYKGGQVSDMLRDLAQHRSLSYSPYVGMATPIDGEGQDFRGHVFCFLPLPLTPGETSLTGLPVHVNGFFALNQSRQHLKWPSADQVDRTQQDKAITWNECLLSEVLPDVYLLLIEELLHLAQITQHDDKMMSLVYGCIPATGMTNERWRKILPPFFHGLLQTNFMRTSEGNWVQYNSAVFSQIEEDVDKEEKQAVIELFKRSRVNLVEVPDHVWKAVKDNCSASCQPSNITPQRLRDLMRTDPTYEKCSRREKLHLLQYAVRDNQCEMLEGLQLLPVYNGTFEQFKSRRCADRVIYICTAEEAALFPGMEHHLADPEWKHLLANDCFQLQPLKLENVKTLLDETIRQNFGCDAPQNWYLQASKVRMGWLEDVWQYLSSHSTTSSLQLFEDLSLIPDMSKAPDLITLHRLGCLYIQRSTELNDGVVGAMKQLGVCVLPSIPSSIGLPQSVFDTYMYNTSPSSVQKLFDEIYLREKGLEQFNINCDGDHRTAFLDFFSTVVCSSVSKECLAMLRAVEIFQEVDQQSQAAPRFVCLNKNNLLAPDETFPVRYHQKLLWVKDHRTRWWATTVLGAKEITAADLTKAVLRLMSQNEMYTERETEHCIIHVLSERWFDAEVRSETWVDSEIRRLMQAIRFVPTKGGQAKYIGDVFAPEASLRRLFPVDRFPREPFNTEPLLSRLKDLGLKGQSDLTAEDLYQCAQGLDSMNEGIDRKNCLETAHAFVSILSQHADKLSIFVSGQKLVELLGTLRWVPAMNTKPSQYPSCLPWSGSSGSLCLPSEVRSSRLKHLLGSVVPLVQFDCCTYLADQFGWDGQPRVECVIHQLECIIERYEDVHKPVLLPLIADIYQHLSHNVASTNSAELALLNRKPCVWTGLGFRPPSMMYVETEPTDIDLQPYIYQLPSEFKHLGQFFIKLGCYERQTSEVLLDVQKLVRDKYSEGRQGETKVVRSDLGLIINILTKLKMTGDVSDPGNILFPVQTSTETHLDLRPAPECTYCNVAWLKDGVGEKSEIIADVPITLAKSLGVPSLTQNLMSDAEDFGEEWGQDEPLTRRLHNLLKDYTDGVSVPKELIQNADDAGANTVCFLYDERNNHDAKTQLLNEGMEDCQGPALWTYNDALFSNEDLRNIRELNGATKESDRSKIGRFGLGFSAVYNLTDVPSFVSGHDLVIFDPHEKHIGKAGLRFNMKIANNQTMVKNQFKPYKGIFGCDLYGTDGKSPHFDGTLFRFPLRTEKQADSSDISGVHYSHKEMRNLLKMFLEAAGNLLLFTQNVEVVKLYHLPSSRSAGDDMDLLFEVKRKTVKYVTRGISLASGEPLKMPNILKHVAEMVEGDKGGDNSQEKIQLSLRMELTVDVNHKGSKLLGIGGICSQSSWIVSWSSGNNDSMTMAWRRDLKGALPLASVAVPIEEENDGILPVSLEKCPTGFYKKGHIFCFLPLPITTKLPVHINGCFSVTADRKKLCHKTEDDKRSLDQEWNEALMADAVCSAYVWLLESMKDHGVNAKYKYHQLWPCDEKDGILGTLHNQFFTVAAEKDHNIVCREQQWASLQDCVFLDQELQSDPGVVQVALDVLAQCQTQKVMEMPEHIAQCFQRIQSCRTILQEHTVSTEMFFACHFFPQINHWEGEGRNKLVLFAIRRRSGVLDELLQKYPCIPSAPDGELKLPGDLVHPKGRIAALFDANDEVFPDKIGGSFMEDSTLARIVELGMMKHTIPLHMVPGRAESISAVTAQCAQCGLERCAALLRYLQSIGEQIREESILDELRNIKFLPVMAKPSDWPFEWFAENNMMGCGSAPRCGKHKPWHGLSSCEQDIELYLEAPNTLYLPSVKELVGCTALVLDIGKVTGSSCTHHDIKIANVLGVRGISDQELPPATVVKQLQVVSRTKPPPGLGDRHATFDWRAMCMNIYGFLDRVCLAERGSQVGSQVREHLRCKSVILVSETFVSPDKVALRATHDSPPDLFSLRNADISRYDSFLNAIGVREQFEVGDFIQTLSSKKGKWLDEPLAEEELEQVVKLIRALADAVKRTSEKGIQSNSDVFLPDEDRVLRPANKLCLEESDFRCNMGKEMKCLNSKIAREEAEILGVCTKRRKHLQMHSRCIPFGQTEALTTRIRGILKGYPCDVGIMKELLQNADDAKATEVHFVKDYRHHPVDKMFSGLAEEVQGPALCVYNNSSFTQDDLTGIQNLGIGSKSSDPTQTGRYGVGFNAVYHLTDTPSFLSRGPDIGETLCMLDPSCEYVPEATPEAPGVRYVDLDDLRESYPDVFTCYMEKQFGTANSTMFRFPLRTEEMAKRNCSILKSSVTPQKIDALMDAFKEQMFEALLFTKYVNKITVSTISGGDLQEEYSVKVDMSEEDGLKRQHFFSSVIKVSQTVTQKMSSLKEEVQRETGYTLTVSDRKTSESWYVAQNFGFSDDKCLPEVVTDACSNGLLGLLPLGGVAFQIPPAAHQLQGTCIGNGKAYCMLPLPVLTGLPMHVNGHFALDSEGRRNLWKNTDNDYKSEWNKCLMNDVIAPAYVSGLQHMKSETFHHVSASDELKNKLEIYYSLFPKYREASDHYWKGLVSAVYHLLLDMYKELFPVWCNTGDQRGAARPRRPTLQSRQAETSPLVKWVSLKPQAGCHFPAYYNDLDDQFRIHDSKDGKHSEKSTRLTEALTKMGMKLLHSPMWLYHTMKEAGIEVEKVSPDNVICFLASFNSPTIPPPHDKCEIELNVHIGHTAIQDINTAECMLSYCTQSVDFNSKVDGLPLLVTNDSKVKLFSVNEPIFVTRFCELLPGSAGSFLHGKMVQLFNKIVMAGRNDGPPLQTVWREFTLDDFAELLEISLPALYKTGNEPVGWDPAGRKIPNKKWMNRFWEFLGKCLPTLSEAELSPEVGAIKRKLQVIGECCLLPGTQTRYDVPLLFPLSNTDGMLNICSFQTERLQEALENLCLPQADLMNLDYVNSSMIRGLVAASDRPLQVLGCLYHHRDVIGVENSLSQSRLPRSRRRGILSQDDCDEIIKYFADNVVKIQRQAVGRVNVPKQLTALPLFVTVSGCATCLTNQNEIVVLDWGCPKEGIGELSRDTGIIFLKHTHKFRVDKLLDSLGLKSITNPIDVYSSYTLPRFGALPVHARMPHLKYIRDSLLCISSQANYSDEQRMLIRVLCEREVVTMSDGTMQKAFHFYSPHNEVFKAFCPRSSFPPEPFCTSEWETFMCLAGMKCEITEAMFVEFAKCLASEGREGVTPDIKTKSQLLVTALWKMENVVKEGILGQVANIRFISPHRVGKKYCKIHPQLDKANDLIAFSGAVPESYEVLVWTSCNLLPSWACPKKWCFDDQEFKVVERQLGIKHNPPIEMVILHVQTICQALKEMLGHRETRDIVDHLMTKLYEHLDKFCRTDATKLALKDTPLVYLEKDRMMVPPPQILLKLMGQDEVKPYLMAAPVRFGQFFPLFEFLGAAGHATANHYAIVLEMLHKEVQDRQMHPNECTIMQTTVKALFDKLQTESDMQITVVNLYLPSRDKELVDSRLLVLSDNAFLEQRLGSVKKCYFLGFTELEIPTRDPIQQSHLIPDKFRLRVLSEIVEERFDSDVTLIESEQAKSIQRFLNSTQFVQGILRLVRHEKFENKDHCDDEQDKTIVDNLQNIKISQVAHLQTCLIDNGEVVPNSIEKKKHFVDEDKTGTPVVYHYYFTDPRKDTVLELIQEMLAPLTQVISKCTGYAMRIYTSYIPQILLSIACPDNISPTLDSENIRMYELTPSLRESLFPPLGTFVPVEFHYLLDNSFTEFAVNEYVAVEVHEPMVDSSCGDQETDAVYVYGKIVKKVPSDSGNTVLSVVLQNYEVDIGERIELVSAYKLYKFHRKQGITSSTLVIFEGISGAPGSDTEPSTRPSTQSKEEIFKELRTYLTQIWMLPEQKRKGVLKRLLLKWHPDKNIGQEKLCTEVFQFIQNLVSRLEQGKDILNADSCSTTKSSYPRPSPSYSYFFSSMHTRGRRHREYFEQERTKKKDKRRPHEENNAHYNAYVNKKNPMPHEAGRWYRQASCDLDAAMTFHRSAQGVSAYNWVCYKCHQAVEKAMKAAWYFRDANHVTRSHNLVTMATGLGDQIEQLAQSLDRLLGDHTKMRYPDLLQTPKIPSDVYSEVQAQQACETAQQILKHVSDEYL